VPAPAPAPFPRRSNSPPACLLCASLSSPANPLSAIRSATPGLPPLARPPVPLRAPDLPPAFAPHPDCAPPAPHPGTRTPRDMPLLPAAGSRRSPSPAIPPWPARLYNSANGRTAPYPSAPRRSTEDFRRWWSDTPDSTRGRSRQSPSEETDPWQSESDPELSADLIARAKHRG